jgi:hypothetical protein
MKVLAKRHTVKVGQQTNSSADGGSPQPTHQLSKTLCTFTLFANNYDISDKYKMQVMHILLSSLHNNG